MSVPFASTIDLSEFWRPLAADEEVRAGTLLTYASQRIRVAAKAQGRDIDADLEAGRVSDLDLRMVVCGMVQRSMLGGVAGSAVSQMQQSAGPFSTSATYANPLGNLYLSKDDYQQLGLHSSRSTGAFSVDLTPGR